MVQVQKLPEWLLLGLILILSSVLRLYQIGFYPASLYWEETALGYDAYSLWQTGKDFHGHPWPVVAFESFGDYKPSGYFYVAAPFVGILGLSPLSVRLPSALAGVLTVYVVYLLGKQLWKRETPALWGALALAVMPWHIQFSRAAFEVNVATFWLLLGSYWLVKASRKVIWFIPGVMAMVASMYTYHGLRVLAPLIGLTILVWNWRAYWRQRIWVGVGLLMGILLLIPQLAALTTPAIQQRFAETSLFSTSPAVVEQNLWRQEDGNSMWSHIIHHRYLIWGKEIVAGMLAHFSPNFLWLEGDGNPRHQTGYFGLLSWWMIVPLGILIWKWHTRDRQQLMWLLLWVVLATLPPALTKTTPHTLRFLPAAPAVALMVGLGMDYLTTAVTTKRWRRWLVKGMYLWIGIELIVWAFDYTHGYVVRSERDWQYGYTQMLAYINQPQFADVSIQMTRAYGRPSMYTLFFLDINPRLVQEAEPSLPKDQGELLAYGRFRFGPIDTSLPSIAVSDKPLSSGTLLHIVDYPDQVPVFYVYDLR